MKVLFWNVRGIANDESRLFLKRLLQENKPDLFFLAKPNTSIQRFPALFWQNKERFPATNNKGSLCPTLWCLCEDSLSPVILEVSDQMVSFSVTVNAQVYYFAAVYGAVKYMTRRTFWAHLMQL